MARARRILARLGKALIGTVVSIAAWVVGLVVFVFVALAIPPVGNFVAQKAIAYANENVLTDMTVKVKRVDRLDPWGIHVRGVQLFDEQGRELAKVPWLLVHLDPLELLNNTLALTRVEVDGARAHLYPSDEPEEEEPEEEPSQPSGFTIRADYVRIRDASLTTEWQGKTLHAVVGKLIAGGQYGPNPAVAIEEASARVTADDDELLRLQSTEGSWRAEKGGRVALEGRVAGADLALTADVPALENVVPYPFRTVELRLSGITRRSLALLGVEDGAELRVPVDIALDARAEDDELKADLKLVAGTNTITLDARTDPEASHLTVHITPTPLGKVAGILPDMKVQGEVELHATPGFDPEDESPIPEQVRLAWRGVVIDGGHVPNGSLKAALPMPVVRLERLTLAGFEKELAAQGEYNTDSERAKVALDFRELELSHIDILQKQGIAGLLDGGLSLKVGPNSLEGKGNVHLLEFSHPSAQLDELALSFDVEGTPSSPRGDLNLRVEQLRAGDVHLSLILAEAEATSKELEATLQASGPNSLMNVELAGQRTTNDQMRLQGIGRGTIHGKDVRFDLRDLIYGDEGVTVQELAAYSGKQAVRLQGSLSDEDVVHAELRLARIDLGEWTRLAGIEEVEGQLDGMAEVDGKLSLPSFATQLELTGASYRAEFPMDVTLAAKGDLRERKGSLELTVDGADELGADMKGKREMGSREELGAHVELSVDLPKRPANLAKAAERAQVKADIVAHLPVKQLSTLAGDDLAGIEGMLDLNLQASGTPSSPKLDAELKARLKMPGADGPPQEALRLTTHVTEDDAEVHLWTGDEEGELLTLNGQVAWPGGNPRAALENPEAWRNASFNLAAELDQRRLDTMQGVFAYFTKVYALNLPLRAGAKVAIQGDQGNLDGDIQARVVVFGDKLDGRCALGTKSALELDAQFKQSDVSADLTVRTDDGGVVHGQLSSHLALNAFTSGEPMVGPAKLSMQGKEIALHKLPGLCNLSGGRASFAIDASGLGKQRPKLDMVAQVDGLQAEGETPMSVTAKVLAADKSASVEAELTSKKRCVGNISASVPLSYPDGTTPTVMPNAPVEAEVRFDRLPLANVLAFTETVGGVEGSLSADLSLNGQLNDPTPKGFVQLDNVDLSIAAIAQPLKDINGRIEVNGRSIKIPKMTVRDREGKLTIEGYASLGDDFSGEAGLFLEADEFPLRQQGTVVGELTTRARLDVTIPEDLQVEAQLKILDGRIWLTGETGKNVQSLEPHPDIRFADEAEAGVTEAEAEASGEGGFGLASFTMKTEQNLWLMHKDFSIQVGVDIALQQGESKLELTGEAVIHRGELTLLGKLFKLQEGVIRFTGDLPPNPELDIKAVYEPPTGEELIVQVTGRANSPELEFSGAASNAGEAVAILTGVGGGASQNADGQASNEMAKVAADMTAGLLIVAARREYGDWVPMISVETGASGQPTSARAGFDASKLIPPWASGFAKGAYVEGIVGQGAGGAGVGVNLEVALPRDFVTTLGYGPGNGWSTDVAWAP